MALIKEDGTIVASANAYANEADSVAYMTNLGRQAWIDATTEVREAALVRATAYIESRWALKFKGSQIGDVQTLSWPRNDTHYPRTGNPFAIDAVPVDILNASILYAAQIIGPEGDDLASMTSLEITPELDGTGRTIKSKREKVDVLEEETVYADGSSLRTIQPIPEADRLIRPWLINGGVSGLTARI